VASATLLPYYMSSNVSHPSCFAFLNLMFDSAHLEVIGNIVIFASRLSKYRLGLGLVRRGRLRVGVWLL